MKNTIELRKVPCGETFTVFGEEFVVLDHIDGGVLSIRKAIWKKALFDTSGKNNFAEASIQKVLGEYAGLLKERGANDDAFRPQRIDLKATDGTRVYGYYECDVALLTLEQYGKYKDIIPFADDWWWLASPWATRWLRSPNTGSSGSAWFVNANGNCGLNGCSGSYGVRPALNFDSYLLVSLTCDEKEDVGEDWKRKEDEWNAYISYLNDWADDHSDNDSYGQTPASFDEWLEEEYEPDEE